MKVSQQDLFSDLSPAQRIMLAEMLWDTVAASANTVPLDSEILSELDRRLNQEASGLLSYETWDSVKRQLMGT